jgi:hypothetical protein
MNRPARLTLWTVLVLGGFACSDGDAQQCSEGTCSVAALPASYYCRVTGRDCGRLESLSKDCIGSHTEVTCHGCAGTFVRVGSDDAAELFFDSAGNLAAVRRFGDWNATCAAWSGLDLSDCVNIGKPVEVACDGNRAGP